MRLGMILGTAVSIGWAPLARAECTTSYVSGQLTEDLGQMTISLQQLDQQTFELAGNRLQLGLPCLKTAVPTGVFASAYRYLGVYHHLGGRMDDARRWFRSSLELDSTYDWDINDLPFDHPIRRTFEEERSNGVVDPVAVEGQVIAPGAGATLLLDGRKLKKAAATMDRPHLLQVVGSEDGMVRQVFLIEGNAIPEQMMRAATDADVTTTPTFDRGRVELVQRNRPAAKTPLLVMGGVGLAAGVGLYTGSFITRQKFNKATRTDDLLKYRTTTNTLVIASGATFLVGLGTGYAGMVLGGSPGVWYSIPF